jgi:hypothetical protein
MLLDGSGEVDAAACSVMVVLSDRGRAWRG